MGLSTKNVAYFFDRNFQRIPAKEIYDVNTDFRPLVSVLMITWNHEPYIAQSIESILNQHCSFSFELIIGEDFSQDYTKEICLHYQQLHPKIIRVVTADENVGMHKNLSRIWSRAYGKYLAFCEGDDYWIDPNKLANQTALMESRQELTLCGTYTQKIVMDANGSWAKAGMVGPSEVKEEYTLEDLIPNYTFHFSSVMIRKDSVRFPKWLWDVYCADRPLYLLCAEKGPVGFIPEITSVYRMHVSGIWASLNQLDKARKGIKLFKTIDRYFDYRYDKLIRQTLGDIIWSYMAEVLEKGDRPVARALFWMSIRYQFSKINALRILIISSVILQLYTPFLYKTIRNLKANHSRP